MARTKKADTKKDAVKATDKTPETPGQTEGTTPATETQEQAEGTAPATETPDLFAGIQNPCVYCGPTVRGVARQYTTYMGGIPEPLKEFVKEHPAVRGLIVPTEKFAAVRKRLETRGTAEAIIYKRVKDEL